MIVATAILINALAGGAWRRLLGGWLHLHRYVTIPLGLFLAWPLFVAFPWPIAGLLAGLAVLFFVPGHQTADNSVFVRYGPFGAGYWLAHRYLDEKEWARRGWPASGFVDGWMALGELFLGATFWGTVALVGLAL